MNTANYMTKLTGYECQQVELPPFVTNTVLSVRDRNQPLFAFTIDDDRIVGTSLDEKEASIVPKYIDAEYIYCHDRDGGTFYKFNKLSVASNT